MGKDEENNSNLHSKLRASPDFLYQFFFFFFLPMNVTDSLFATAQWFPLQYISFTQAGNIIKINYYFN